MTISPTLPALTRVILILLMTGISLTALANDVEEGKIAYRQKDYQSALHSWTQAAQNNNAEAQWLLGVLLFNGQAAPQDKAAAYSWLTLASEKNYSHASTDLVKITPMLSAEDIAVAETLTQSFKNKQELKVAINNQEQEAFHWFLKAAEKNDSQAQYRVGKMLLNGQGIKQDKVAAYSWFTLANEQNQLQAAIELAELKSKLSLDEIKAANQLSKAHRNQQFVMSNSTESPVFNNRNKSPQNESKAPTIKAEKQEQGIRYRVQIGAFKSKEHAKQALTKLSKKLPDIVSKYDSTVTEPEVSTKTPMLHRLQLGNFINKHNATTLCQKLAEKKQACFIVTVKPKD